MRQAIIFFSILILNISYLRAQDTLSLSEAISIGLSNNYQIRLTRKQLEIDRNNNSWGTAGLYPRITLNMNSTGTFEPYTDSVFDVNTQQFFTITPAINLNWTVFNGFSARISKERLALIEQESEGNSAIVIENTLQSILLGYYFVLLQQEALDVLVELRNLSRDRYRYVITRKEFGNAVTFDVLQAQNNYLADSANALRQEINYRNALRNLNLILAEPVDRDFVIRKEILDVDQEFEIADMLAKIDSSNKALRNQYINQEILRKNIQDSRSDLYPMLSLSAGLGRTYTGIYGDWQQYSWDNNNYRINAGLNLSYTLSNGGNVRRAIRNAQIREEMGQLQLDQMRQSLYNQLFTMLEQYRIRRQLVHVAEARLESARLNLQIGDEKFRNGSINSFNYRDIQLAYLNAALEAYEAKYNLTDSYTELLRLTGGILTEYGE